MHGVDSFMHAHFFLKTRLFTFSFSYLKKQIRHQCMHVYGEFMTIRKLSHAGKWRLKIKGISVVFYYYVDHS
jgi:hypothetical protein